jgi:hypothetical protein
MEFEKQPIKMRSNLQNVVAIKLATLPEVAMNG